MEKILGWLRERRPLLLTALLLGALLAAERLTFQVGRNLLPLLIDEFGELAGYLPFAMGAGGVLGFVVWLAAGMLGAGRGWAAAFLTGLVAAGAVATFAPGVGLLLGATAATGLAGFGGSVMLASACERLGSDSRRRDLNHRANAIAEVVTPVLLALVTLLAHAGGWRAAMAAGALIVPLLAFVPLLAVGPSLRRAAAPPQSADALGLALGDLPRQLREPATLLAAGAAAATTMAISPFVALMALAVVEDGIGLDVVAALTLLAVPTAFIGHVWERVFGVRPRAALSASYLPAIGGWVVVLVLELLGGTWPVGVQIALWGVASVALRLAQFTTTLVARGLVLSVGDGPLPAGAISVRSAIQSMPPAVAGMIALLIAPWLFRLGWGLAPVAVAALVLLVVAVALMHRAHRTPGSAVADGA